LARTRAFRPPFRPRANSFILGDKRTEVNKSVVLPSEGALRNSKIISPSSAMES